MRYIYKSRIKRAIMIYCISLTTVCLLAQASPQQDESLKNQDFIDGVVIGNPKAHVEESLNKYGVEITPTALTAALVHENRIIRDLASVELGRLKVYAAVPALMRAVDIESDIGTRNDMLLALALLGEKSGPARLQEMCRSADVDIVVDAANQLLDYRDIMEIEEESCFNPVMKILKNPKGNHDRPLQNAMWLMLRYRRHLQDKNILFAFKNILIKQLGNTNRSIRGSASQVYARLIKHEAIMTYENYIKHENHELNLNSAKKALAAFQELHVP